MIHFQSIHWVFKITSENEKLLLSESLVPLKPTMSQWSRRDTSEELGSEELGPLFFSYLEEITSALHEAWEKQHSAPLLLCFDVLEKA